MFSVLSKTQISPGNASLGIWLTRNVQGMCSRESIHGVEKSHKKVTSPQLFADNPRSERGANEEKNTHTPMWPGSLLCLGEPAAWKNSPKCFSTVHASPLQATTSMKKEVTKAANFIFFIF